MARLPRRGVPVLLVSGGARSGNAAGLGRSAAVHLPNSARFVDSMAGHGVMSHRLITMIANFIIYHHAVAESAPR